MKNRSDNFSSGFEGILKRYIFRVFAWLSIPVMFWAYKTNYIPSEITVYSCFIFSVILGSCLIYMIETGKLEYEAKMKYLPIAPKLIVYISFFGMYYFLSVYLFSYTVHSVLSKQEQRLVYIVPKGESGRRLTYCNKTVSVIDAEAYFSITHKPIEYCFDSEEYSNVLDEYSDQNNQNAKIFMGKYKKSNLGYEFLSADKINTDKE